MKYYAMVRAEHLERASGLTSARETNRVAHSVQVTGGQSDSLATNEESQTVAIPKENTRFRRFSELPDTILMGEEGSEYPPDSHGKSSDSEKVVPFVVPFQGTSEPSEGDVEFRQLGAIWQNLRPASKAQVVAFASRLKSREGAVLRGERRCS